jgi:ElaB/YqjD/DUF883 family membrane-anchored ribosome-binding protein
MRKKNDNVAYLSSKVDQLNGKIGQEMRSIAGALRARSPHEMIRKTTYNVAAKLDRAGSYLEGSDSKAVLADFGSAVSRSPMKLILIGAGVGFLLARARGK